ncbi:MAG TPA: DUF480 domain-containing protein [Pirellulales bacterium]|jgi:hypothetical protein|nr:DUF480 domain-containing protein [Pirellulales bacterium]
MTDTASPVSSAHPTEAAESSEQSSTPARRWQPLSAVERRVLGVLLEKAKTTTDAYPMTLNAIRVGANQKNNRAPLTNYEEDDIQTALDHLRQLGAVAEVIGGGRVPKYRHYFYEWLGVDKVEAAAMAELLLRGAQSEGDLRGRAARMEPIADLGQMRSVLTSLKQKGLVIPITPEGRGQVIAHALYQPQELEKVRAQFAGAGEGHAGHADAAEAPPATGMRGEVEALRAEVASLRAELHALASRLGA